MFLNSSFRLLFLAAVNTFNEYAEELGHLVVPKNVDILLLLEAKVRLLEVSIPEGDPGNPLVEFNKFDVTIL